MDVEEAILKRKSIRRFAQRPLAEEEIQTLLAVGRKTPSAGATRPLILFAVSDKELKDKLCEACLGQESVRNAPTCIVVAANYNTFARYGRRGVRYTYMEAGHAGQNIALKAVEMGLGTVMIGAFKDSRVKEVLGIAEDPLYVILVGAIA